MKTLNLIGKQVGKLRYEQGLTQDELADRLHMAGWPISRSGVSKIEGGCIYVPEFRLFYLAHVFRLANPMPLFPRIDLSQPIHETILHFIHNEKRGLARELKTLDSFDTTWLRSAEKHF